MRSGYNLINSEKFYAPCQREGKISLPCFARRIQAFFLAGSIAWAGSTFTLAQDNETPATNVSTNGPKTGLEYGVGDWIWAAKTHDQQTCRIWKRVVIPKDTSVVELTIAADDVYRLFVDGREVGQGAQWKYLTEYDLTPILGPGAHVLAVECFNQYREAGLVAGLHIQTRRCQSIEVLTDKSWKIVPNDEENWTAKWKADPSWASATVVTKFGKGIWDVSLMHVLYAPPVQPVVARFWQSIWFRILLTVCAILAVLCIWLVGRLAIYAQAQQVVRQERARIARDIHDDLTAGLTQLVLLGEVSRSGLAEGSEAREQVARVCEKARDLSEAMNDIIWMVNSQRDTFGDFTSYVCDYAETFLSSTPIRCRFDVENDMPDFHCDLGVRRNLFLGVKEALNNALRHSGASELLLRIHRRGGQLVVSIEDNGKGFDHALARRDGNGLSNMITRAAEAGGICGIFSQPGAGSRIEFTVPLARERKMRLKFWRNQPPIPDQTQPLHFRSDI